MDKARKVMLSPYLGYVKKVMKQDLVEQQDEENEGQSIGATITIVLKENHMVIFHYHNSLSVCTFARNEIEKVTGVAMKKIDKKEGKDNSSRVDINGTCTLIQSIY